LCACDPESWFTEELWFLWQRERAQQHQVSHRMLPVDPFSQHSTGSRWKPCLHYVPSSFSLAHVSSAYSFLLCHEHPGCPTTRFTCRLLA